MGTKQSDQSMFHERLRIRILLPASNPQTHESSKSIRDSLNGLANYFQREGKTLEAFRLSSPSCIESWCTPGIEESIVPFILTLFPDEPPTIELQSVRLAVPVADERNRFELNASSTSDSPIVLPPNQALVGTGKWPVVGERAPRNSGEPWTVTVGGLVESEKTWTLDELKATHKLREQTVNIHCVTRWSKIAACFEGIPLHELLRDCGVQANAHYVRFVARSDRNHSTSLPLSDALDLQSMIAFTCDGQPLTEEHGGPVRMIVPGRYFYKSLKWLERIELLETDQLGYWESETGYHNRADPWLEERYAVPNLDRQTVMKLFQSKDFSHKDLRSLEASRLQLKGLNASGSLLRDARFVGANLRDAQFDGANLSNAHFQDADLRGATFRPLGDLAADLEGADFRGADLRGAIFDSASCFGASFCDGSNPDSASTAAIIDSTTQMDEATIQTLDATPPQKEFVLRSIRS